MTDVLVCRGLTKRFGNKAAVTDINLSIPSGHIVGLLGPNGSGKSTLLKMINGLLVPTGGELLIDGKKIGIGTKKIISYLPEYSYLNDWMNVRQLIDYFGDFYSDFNAQKAYDMLGRLNIDPKDKLRIMSKGTREKVQLILVMSREAKLYCLDEPIAGVDPATRDYILTTIISNYNPDSTILLSTHLISDVENILDDVIFIYNGIIKMTTSVDEIRLNQKKSVDALFREVFRC